MYKLSAELQKTLVKFKGLEIMLFAYRAYTKHQYIHVQESSKKSGFLYSALQRPVQHCVVTASDVKILLNRNPLKRSKELKIFFEKKEEVTFCSRYKLVLTSCLFIVVSRPDTKFEEVQNWLQTNLKKGKT